MALSISDRGKFHPPLKDLCGNGTINPSEEVCAWQGELNYHELIFIKIIIFIKRERWFRIRSPLYVIESIMM